MPRDSTEGSGAAAALPRAGSWTGIITHLHPSIFDRGTSPSLTWPNCHREPERCSHDRHAGAYAATKSRPRSSR